MEASARDRRALPGVVLCERLGRSCLAAGSAWMQSSAAADDLQALDEAGMREDEPFRDAVRERIEPGWRSRTRSPRPTANSTLTRV
jgi:hypothetical protein